MLTTPQLSAKLKALHKRPFPAAEINKYAKQLGLKENYRSFGARQFYLWTNEDVVRLKQLISQENEH